MRRFFTAALAALCLISLSGCASGGSPPAGSQNTPTASSSSANPNGTAQTAPSTDEERAAVLTASMTTEEKVGQLFFARCPETNAVKDISTYHLGGYLLFGRDTKDQTANELIQTIHAYQDAAGAVPLLIGVDEEGGSVVRVSSNPNLRREKFKSPQQLFADGGMKEIAEETHEKDILLSALGFNVNLAPVADVSTNPGDFIYARSFGQDADNTSRYVADVVSGMCADGMGSVLKHFPGYGSNADTHTGIAVDRRPLETFQSSDFLPFSAGIAASDGKMAILVSHNIMTCVDSTLPASLSPQVHQCLREGLGFRGVIMTDDLAMDAVQSYAKDGRVAVLAVKAGNDLLITTDYRTQIPQVLDAVQTGQLSEGLIDAACTRVLVWKMALGLLQS